MRVVFLSDVEGTAQAGEIKNVADGFARNFLLPRGLAAAATAAHVQKAESRARAIAREQEKVDESARGIASKLEGITLTLPARVGEQGRLYGSITSSDIAEELSKLAGSELEHRQIALDAPIKEVGSQELMISLSRNVKAKVTVAVVSMDGDTKDAEAKEPETKDAESEDEE